VLADYPTYPSTPNIYVTFLDPLKYGIPPYPEPLPEWYLSIDDPQPWAYYNVLNGQKHFVISVLNS